MTDVFSPSSASQGATNELLELDRSHVWHPYSPMPGREALYLVTGAAGAKLYLDGGRELIDGMSSLWVAVHGHRNPTLDKALTEQALKFSHVMFGGLTHEPAVRLAAGLADSSPAGLDHVFFSESGSIAVEVAMKMALQYSKSMRKERKRFLTWRRGFHGGSLHAMSVGDTQFAVSPLWQELMPFQVFAPAPPISPSASLRFGVGEHGSESEMPNLDGAYVDKLAKTVRDHADELAAIIVEPMVQSFGGVRMHDAGYLRILRQLADDHDLLLIFDELATGFGHTGEFFAAEHSGVSPDIMCIGKALTGGYISMAGTMCSSKVAETISQGTPPILAHGTTFTGNPLASAVANASLGLFANGNWKSDVKRIETELRKGLQAAVGMRGVSDVRVLGAIAVIELERPINSKVARTALDNGVWLRPVGNLIYCTPPYVCTDDEIAQICSAMVAAAATATAL
ncbi:adenosylmethionine--8-amino-7-oxononanoate transaminase [Dietzia timorensis]|uniref:adenosylmethionine--8-amino-7-oxononanoate transaminase n=1 Tax=Dietzia timorensis TaxID=499555 RepID=UPI000830A07D|nr:adenosylmethionine--8-amino-7-oxononanoate transaminase [Dietzia timorensis]